MIKITEITEQMLDVWIGNLSRGDNNQFILLVGRKALDYVIRNMGGKYIEPFAQREYILEGYAAIYHPKCEHLFSDHSLLELIGTANNVLIAFDPNNPKKYIENDDYVMFGNVPEDIDIRDISLVAKSNFDKLEMNCGDHI